MKETPERILHVIYKLSLDNQLLKSVSIGKKLGLTRPDVFRSLKLLKNCGYVYQKPYGKIALTEKGRDKAEKMHRIHRGLVEFLSKMVGLSPDEASATAYSAEHILSESAIDKIIELLVKFNMIDDVTQKKTDPLK
ncbi:MAG: metal-dependent transcriptional regulator [Christensenellaceae bacterium]|jgi:Mn-dependent DtxR family transcriptional regulator|nr:metal-dependent transcriptional regulator [Christensenellaceae bacterium]